MFFFDHLAFVAKNYLPDTLNDVAHLLLEDTTHMTGVYTMFDDSVQDTHEKISFPVKRVCIICPRT